jgi:uncharacterized membrane protein
LKPNLDLSRCCTCLCLALGSLFWVTEARAQRPGLFELWVSHELVDCPSDQARLCYQIKEEQYAEWQAFEGSIANFPYREGVAYVLLVEMDPVTNTDEPARTRYRVVQVLDEFESFDQPTTPARVASSALEASEPVEAAEPVLPAPLPASEVAAIEAESEPVAVEVESTEAATPSPPVVAPARSSAARGNPHRGILIIGSGTEARSFTPCGQERGIWIEDESGSELWRSYRSAVEGPNQPLMIEVLGELEPAPSSGFGSYYPRQLTVFAVQRIDASNLDCGERPQPVADERPAKAAAPVDTSDPLVISGGPPAWTLTVGPAGMVYSSPSQPETVRFPYLPAQLSTDRATFISGIEGPPPHSLKVVVTREPCPAPETGARRELTAYVTLDGRWLRGCVISGDPLAIP